MKEHSDCNNKNMFSEDDIDRQDSRVFSLHHFRGSFVCFVLFFCFVLFCFVLFCFVLFLFLFFCFLFFFWGGGVAGYVFQQTVGIQMGTNCAP